MLARALDAVSRPATSAERAALAYIVGERALAPLVRARADYLGSAARSLYFGTNPVVFMREHLERSVLTDEYVALPKIDGESFHLIQVPPVVVAALSAALDTSRATAAAAYVERVRARLVEARAAAAAHDARAASARPDAIDALLAALSDSPPAALDAALDAPRSALGALRAWTSRAVVTRATAALDAIARALDAATDDDVDASARVVSELRAVAPKSAAARRRAREAAAALADVAPRVFLVGRGDASPGAERLYALDDGVFHFAQARDAQTPLVLDGELALRRRSTPETRERERRRTLATYADTERRELDDAASDAAVPLDLAFVVSDCLFYQRYVGGEPATVRATCAKALVCGVDPARSPPHTVGDAHRFSVVYKHALRAGDARALASDIEPSLVGFDVDGIILLPPTPYRVGTDASLFKVKPRRLLSVDVRARATGERVDFVACSPTCARTCAAHVLGAAPRDVLASVEARDGDIVELEPRDAGGRLEWTPVRVRRDKSRPNARATLVDVMRAAAAPVRYAEVFDALARAVDGGSAAAAASTSASTQPVNKRSKLL